MTGFLFQLVRAAPNKRHLAHTFAPWLFTELVLDFLDRSGSRGAR